MSLPSSAMSSAPVGKATRPGRQLALSVGPRNSTEADEDLLLFFFSQWTPPENRKPGQPRQSFYQCRPDFGEWSCSYTFDRDEMSFHRPRSL